MNALLSSIHAGDDAPVLVIFGGNPHRRHDVLSMLQQVGGINAYGAVSEAEGMQLLQTLPRVNLVMIGGRYSEAERVRIRAYVSEMLPGTPTTEPGYDYPYDNDVIIQHVTTLLRASPRQPRQGSLLF